ncbi:hypothetical protein NQ315_007135 [Exocentrus adspersus]|uniref:Luciferin 4-monooxygenase n=1 Tax=Exocentrus adspersus TaxID=1586481 RepID=A0AAV8WCK4_9CUCU|nr:hypothetical protein NQ315_007135 [Exocentrus adspersus]
MSIGQVDDDLVICGPTPAEPLLEIKTAGKEIFEKLLTYNTAKDAIIDAFTEEKLSYGALLQKICDLAEALRFHGYTTGTVVSICSENNINFFIPVLASLFIGCIMAPVNHNYVQNELIHLFNISKPKVVFCSKNVSLKILDLKATLSYISRIIIIDSDESAPGTETLDEFVTSSLRGRHISPYHFQPLEGDPAKLGAFIFCSSGTTGFPKGVLLSQKNMYVRLLQSRDPRYYVKTTGENKSILGLLPFFHAFGMCIGLEAITRGDKLIVLKRFDEDMFLKCIQDYKISELLLAPPIAVFLEKSSKVLQYDLSSVKEIVCGAAPLSRETEQAIRKKLKNIQTIRQGYGLTEATLAITLLAQGEQRPGSCGRVITFMSCKVRDPETGKALGPNTVGELCFKGPMVMAGYYNDEKATKETFTPDGWLRTGDLGYYDKEKYFYIVDRMKELIKYKGFQVAPAELEALLLNHPKVRDVGVVGLPDDIAGELPVAFVVKKEGHEDVTEAELQNYVASMVSSPKHLRGGVIFVSEIPKNPSGKILRRVLKDRLKGYRPTKKI